MPYELAALSRGRFSVLRCPFPTARKFRTASPSMPFLAPSATTIVRCCRALDELKRSIGTLNEKSDEARSALACDIGKAKNEIIRAVNRRQRSVDSTKVPDDRDVREQILLYVRLLAANPRMETGTACAKVLRRHPSGYARKTSLISFVARHAEFIEDCIDVFKATGRVPVLEA